MYERVDRRIATVLQVKGLAIDRIDVNLTTNPEIAYYSTIERRREFRIDRGSITEGEDNRSFQLKSNEF
jgi:hypothetical protein